MTLKQFKLEYALRQYKEGKVTLWKASEIADMPLWTFMEKVKEEKISRRYSIEDAREDIKRAFKFCD